MEEIRVGRVLIQSKNRHKLLLVRRAMHNVANPGMWECPGGRRDRGKSLRETVEKKIPEETGLTRVNFPEEEKFVEVDRTLAAEWRFMRKIFITEFIIGFDQWHEEVKLDLDYDGCAWVSYEEALSYDLTPQTHKGLIALYDRLKVPA